MLNILLLVVVFLIRALNVLQWFVLIYVILSWLPQLRIPKIRKFFNDILGPLFDFARKHTPKMGMIDISPIIVIILIDVVHRVLIMIAKSIM